MAQISTDVSIATSSQAEPANIRRLGVGQAKFLNIHKLGVGRAREKTPGSSGIRTHMVSILDLY